MQIILVSWLIHPDKEDEFKQYWKSALPVQDRSKMVGEFLSEPTGHELYEWITWDLRAANAKKFINVGLWADADAFHDQIGRYFNPTAGKMPFEVELRRRALLTPAGWRMGNWHLPDHDSEGVL